MQESAVQLQAEGLRIEWLLKSKPNLIIALGGNDGLRGVPIEETKRNLEKSYLPHKQKYPHNLSRHENSAPIMESNTPKNLLIYILASQTKNVPLIPFWLEGVGGEPSLNLPDRIP